MRIRVIVMLAFFSACNNDKKSVNLSNDGHTTTSEQSPIARTKGRNGLESPVDRPSTHCYIRASGRDTVILTFEQTGSSIAGRLKFDNYQIDGSSGTVAGKIRGDIIELWYDFEAEGVRSVRQLFFKKVDVRLLWGKGQQVSRHDSLLFTDVKNITYGESLLMNKAACDRIGF